MVAKYGAMKRRAFLAALAATGNRTLAAERAKVSRSWVQLHRSADPEFRRAVDEAVAAARERLLQHGARKPGPGWGYLDGEELVVKGTGGGAFAGQAREVATLAERPKRGHTDRRRVQIARARLKQWSPRVERRFLEALSATCNVKASCAEVGLTPASAYAHRRRWPKFAERWTEALERGREQLEHGLILAASNFLSGEPEVGPIRDMTVGHALEIWESIARQKIAQAERRRYPGWHGREPDIEEVRFHLVRAVDAVRASDSIELARAERAWALRRDDGEPHCGQGILL